MRVNFMVCCEHATRLENGAPALIGVFRGIQARELPAFLDPFFLAIEIEVDSPMADRSYFLELRLIDEDGISFLQRDLEVEFRRRPDLGPSYCYFCERIAVEREIERRGPFRFDLLMDDEILASVRLDVS